MTSSYCTFPISKVLGLIAAINPIRTAGIPGVRETKQTESAMFLDIFFSNFEKVTSFTSIHLISNKGGYTNNTLLLSSVGGILVK